MSQLPNKTEIFYNLQNIAVKQTTDQCNTTILKLHLPVLKEIMYDKEFYRSNIHLFCL